jgi:Ca2+-binding RTX toxin-like protein
VEFADGTVWTGATIQSMVPPLTDGNAIYGTPGDDALVGAAGQQEMHGLEGADRLEGGAGDDRLFGGQGADVLLGGAGSDELDAGGNVSEELGGDGHDYDADVLDGGPGDDGIFIGGRDTVVIGRGGGFDQVRSDVWRQARLPGFMEQAQAELDAMAGLAANDAWQSAYWAGHRDFATYWTIPGDIESTLHWMNGSVSVADARTALESLVAWLDNAQTVRFGPGIRPADLSVQADHIDYDPASGERPSSVRLAIGCGGGDGVLISFDWFDVFDPGLEGWPTVADCAVKRFVFDDGSEMTLAEVLALADGGAIGYRNGGDADEHFRGSVAADTIYGADGNDGIDACGNEDQVDGGAGEDALAGGDGDDALAGGEGDDVIAGGKGDDRIDGGLGEDVVVFNRGDGADTLAADWAGGGDSLSFGAGVLPADVAMRLDADGSLVFLVDGGDGGRLTLPCFDPAVWPPESVPPLGRVQFLGADGTVRAFDFQALFVDKLPALLTGLPLPLSAAAAWEFAAAPAGGDRAVAYAQTGDLFGTAYYAAGNQPGDGDDRLAAGDGGASIDAGAGDDAVGGGNGDDALSGGAGNDLIEGGAGADVIAGGTGNDILRGGGGDDELSGGGGTDRAEGGAGADTYRFGLGDGTLEVREAAGTGAENVLAFGAGIAAADLALSYADGVLAIAVASGGDRVRLLDFDPAWPESAAVGRIVFADGTELMFADLLARGFDLDGTGGDDLLVGGAQGDRISGGEGDDLIVGGAGDDMLAGGAGDDVYVFNPGDGHDTIDAAGAAALGDTLRFGEGIAAADLAFEFAAGGLNIRIGDDAVRILGIGGPAAVGDGPLRRLSFADGSVLELDELFGGGQPVIEGTPGNDTLQGGDAGARFVPLAGDDQMAGGLGDDTYVVAAGGGIDSIRDIARQGAGNTLVFDMAAALAGAVRLSHDPLAGTLDLSVPGAGTVVRLEDFDRNDPLGARAVERFQLGSDGPTVTYAELIARGFDIAGGDGDDALLGTCVADRIGGGAGDDRIESGPGDDLVAGGVGDDTYVFNRGDGILTIDDAALPGEGNVLRFGAGIERSELARALRFVAPGADSPGLLIVRLGDSGDEIRLLGFDPADPEFGAHAVESFVFADGSSMSYRELLRETFVVRGDEMANGLGGTGLGDRLYGYEADDTLDAAAGDDVLTGGTGSDTLRGGAGRDAYVFNPGDGIDTIADAAEAGVGNIVVFGDGIVAGDLSFRMDGGTLAIRYGEGDEVRVPNYSPAAPAVDTLEFADGSVLSLAALLNRAPVVAGQAGTVEFAEDAAGEYVLPAGLFVDPEGTALGLSASLADGTPLPSWLAFDPATGKFSGTPENVDVGSLPVRVAAVDPFGAAAAAEFALVVTNANDAPVATQSLADVQVGEDAPFAWALPAGLFADEDRGDRLAYAATLADGSPLPAWLAFDPATLSFGGTPGNADVGTLAVRIVATDLAGATGAAQFALTVTNANDAPQVGASLADAAAVEDADFLYQLPADAFADVDAGDRLALSATRAGGAPLPSWLAFDPYAGVFHGMPGDGDVGDLNVQVTATDLAGAAVAQTLVLTVAGVNDAPLAGADDFAIDEDGALAVAASALLANDSDPDGAADALRLAAVGNATHGTVAIDASGGIVFTPDANYHGQAGFDYTVADGEGATAVATVGIAIAPANDAPVVAVPIEDQAAKAGSAFTYGPSDISVGR